MISPSSLSILLIGFSLLWSLDCLLGRFGFDTTTDVLQYASYSSFKCLRHHNFSFAILQVFDNEGNYNWKIDQVTKWAWEAGFQVDVYIFMCPNCRGNNPPESVVQNIIINMRNQQIRYGRLWFAIQQCDECWNGQKSNSDFITRAISRALNLNTTVGIYSSKTDWSVILGDNTSFNKFPLWYVNWDNCPNFNDGLYRFGGWTKPTIKQYFDRGPCEMEVNIDWDPD